MVATRKRNRTLKSGSEDPESGSSSSRDSVRLDYTQSTMSYHIHSRSAICKQTTIIIILSISFGLMVTFGVLYGLVSSSTSDTGSSKLSGGSAMKVCCRGLQRVFSPWSYSCQSSQCIKSPGAPQTRRQLLSSCKLTCGSSGGIWPKPSGTTRIGNTTVPIIPSSIKLNQVVCTGGSCNKDVTALMKQAFSLFHNLTIDSCSTPTTEVDISMCQQEAKANSVQIKVTLKSQSVKLSLSTSEAYSLKIDTSPGVVAVTINADTFFGARHALETVSQLISYEMLSDSLQIVSSAQIEDRPAFPYRGVMLDTSRNFFSVKSIIRLLDAMSYNKLNTFHWHITDTHSFPIVIEKLPNMSFYGAYSERQRYTADDVTKIVNHATARGIRVVPEFDQPAHAGNGWQWGEEAGLGQLAFCVNQRPWTSYCVEPPCGQLNPLNDNVYDILGTIYEDYIQRFNPDIFHFGGDEVNIGCWNTSKEIIDWMQRTSKSRTEEDFLDLWNDFLVKATKKFNAKIKQDIPLVVWSSKMTEKAHLTKYLNNKTNIIHLWNAATDKSIPNILNNSFRVILSNYDHTYLDCGFGSWVADGNNWCSPYKQWQLQYNLNPKKMVAYFNLTQDKVDLVLGGETNMWSEQVDESSLEMKVWPRSAALAERMWTNPTEDWRAAEQRLMHHRQLLVERGIKADALKPQWCYQNSGRCIA